MLDVEHRRPPDLEVLSDFDTNQYRFGRIGGHNVVLAILQAGVYGITQAALASSMMRRVFPSIQFALMVGIGGGVPSESHDIRLGDVVVSMPVAGYPGVLQYDFGKLGPDGEVTATGALNRPAPKALAAIAAMQADYMMRDSGLMEITSDALRKHPRIRAKFSHPGMVNDVLYRADYDHVAGNNCRNCSHHMAVFRTPRETTEPNVHYGLIGSGNQVIKNGKFRERLREKHGVLCFETEAAGALEAFRCLVIRGICDYADSHKNDMWQGYAALTAAAYTKDLLLLIEGSVSPESTASTSPSEADIPENINLGLPAHGVNQGATHYPSNPLAQSPQVYQQPINSEPPPRYTPSAHSFQHPSIPVMQHPQQPEKTDSEKKHAEQNTSPPRPFVSQSSQPPNHSRVRKYYGRMVIEAAKAGNMPVVKKFLEKGGDPNITTDDWDLTALHYAAMGSHNGLTQLLLRAGANPNARAKYTNNTPLFETASSGHRKVIQYLLRHGADVEVHCQRGKTALHAAAEKGHVACVELLVQSKADPDSIDEDGHTPLDLAKKEDHLEIVKYLQRI
ncbi:hypothetical protein AnigIFM63326_007650 [Aspergillus niger]|nr:hypothetical protein AnigIFM63326_007650 [Aspergillus niger]